MNYPILMAADILLYNTDVVPVGDDQKQHIEFSRGIAKRFNKMFGKILNIPKILIPENGSRIMGFDNPNIKMSKSFGNKKNHLISLLDSPKKIRNIIMNSVTDSNGCTNIKDASLGIKNLCTILKSLSNLSYKNIENEFLSKGYGYLKRQVIDAILNTIDPIQKKYKIIMNDFNYIKEILTKSQKDVNNIARKNMEIIRKNVGLDIFKI
jgi:tryptophanyl-tRNA synthetase